MLKLGPRSVGPSRNLTPPAPSLDGLTVSSVTKQWSGSRSPVLEAVNLCLAPGSLCWLTGRNGSGKTTLLRIIAGLLRPDAGSVRLACLDPEAQRKEYQRRLGFLSAGNTGLHARLSVRQQLQYWALIAFVAPIAVEAAVDRAVDTFELSDLGSRRVDRLSLGQRQRVRLAMAFLHSPSLVLLDEPTTSLDDEGIALLCHEVVRATSAGDVVIWCAPTAGDLGAAHESRFRLADGHLSEVSGITDG